MEHQNFIDFTKDVRSKISRLETEGLILEKQLESIGENVDECLYTLKNMEVAMSTSTSTTSTIDPNLMAQIQGVISNLPAASAPAFNPSQLAEIIDKKFDQKSDEIVGRVLEAQEAGKSWYQSPVVIGCVAGGILLAIGGTLYLMNQRLNTLEELSLSK